ncbi:uroporphyrinogen-III decarboxylase [Solibacillus faecavium]|uniref:uroporphyrinogen-III decarboxylase n=1 Tax=Solibacillus TaxID=648800 RepID=UPI00296AC817|nr:uroporphyrinogen-III decarboxylase [Solibacillus faecavium]
MIFLEDAKFAELNNEKLSAIKQLEEKLDVTLIAYDITGSNSHIQNGNSPDVINPS